MGAGKGGPALTDDSKPPSWDVSTRQRTRARSLRANSTDAERLIWAALRDHRLNGAGFRRQTPIGPYIVDFVCHAANLVIELDGGQHFEEGHEKRDAQRDAFLADRGFRVLRFSNHDVMMNRAGVLETIAAVIVSTPTPTLPRHQRVYARLRRALRGRGARAATTKVESCKPCGASRRRRIIVER